MPYADAGIVGDLCRIYYDRYEVSLMIAETASVGNVARRHKWMNESVAQVIDSRSRGIPVVGYTWWPMLALVTWAYRQQGLHDLSHYILQMGLWDFDRQGDDPIRRLETPLIEVYRSLVESDLNRIGEIRR